MANFSSGGSRPTPNYGRMMVFVDGENLVFRYQELEKTEMMPHVDVKHEKDIFVWHPETISPDLNIIIRVNYYTYLTGNKEKQDEIEAKMKNLTFRQASYVQSPNNIQPIIFNKLKKQRKTKGVDIQMTVDILNHVHSNNLDVVYIIGGDGDYLPLIKEVIRSGKQVYLAAFTSGLNKNLLNSVDKFTELDNIYFSDNKLP